MSEKGLNKLFDRRRCFYNLRRFKLEGNELNEKELDIIKDSKDIIENLNELSVTVKDNIDKSELKSFLETFRSIKKIKLNGMKEEEKKEIQKDFFNVG